MLQLLRVEAQHHPATPSLQLELSRRRRTFCNLVLGRLFDVLLDMFEVGLNGATFQGMEAFEGVRKAVVRVGSKPALVFQGESWDSNAVVVLRNFFLDFFAARCCRRLTCLRWTARHRPSGRGERHRALPSLWRWCEEARARAQRTCREPPGQS